MDPEDQPDPHAAARERRETKRRTGMRVTGRSTRQLPGIIARRDRETIERSHRGAGSKRQGPDRVAPRADDRGGVPNHGTSEADDRGGPEADDRGGPEADDREGPEADDREGPEADDRDR